MKDYLPLGSSPGEEIPAQVGSENYQNRARKECNAYIAQLRRMFGYEPVGAKLKIKSNEHEAGIYFEVVCYYDNKKALDYAMRLESNSPGEWDAEAKKNLNTIEEKIICYKEVKPIGCLIDGLFVCNKCSEERQQEIPIAKENIGIYSQQCNTCHQLIINGLKRSDGEKPLNLFDLRFTWSRLNYLKVMLNKAVKEEDWESYSINERILVKEFLNEFPRLIESSLDMNMWHQIIDYVNADYPRY